MKKKTILNPGWLTLLMIVAGCALQIWVIPALRSAFNGQLSIYLTVCVAALYLLALIPLCRAAKGATLPDRGTPSAWLGGAAVMAGVGTAVTNAVYVWIWASRGITPPPFSAFFNEVDHVSLIATLVCGLLGGAALTDIGVRWLQGLSVRTGGVRWMTLLPILWAFARLIRYTESYTSTIRNAFSFPNAAMLILTTGFLLQLGRHLLGRGGEGQSRSLAVLSFGTALMGIGTPLLRILLTRFKPDMIADVIQMADASDFCVGLLALAVGWTLCISSDDGAAEPVSAEYPEPADPAEV
ncbi:MAG: hypothetical protein IKI63_06665 [Clostridia bacterium]|nr:hypothetical protein [Clostridia bacterium]